LNTAYSTSLIGGSGYFDGSGDFLVNSTANVQIPSSTNFTVEFRVYVLATTTANQGQGVVCLGNSAANRAQFTIYGSAARLEIYGGTLDISGGTIPINTWTHVAWVRSGSTITVYINGVAATTGTSSAVIGNTSGFTIGSNSEQSTTFNGYISGLRVVNGTALYTSNFASPITPPTAVSGTSLLTNFTNAGIIDNTAKNVLETVNSAQLSTAQSKWGGSSMYFSGSSPYSYLKGSPTLASTVAFGTADFTIECWVYLTTTATDSTIIDTRAGANSGNYFLFYLWNGGYISWYVPGGYVVNTGSQVSANTWTHVAISRASGTLRSFKDGVLQQSATNTTSYANPGAPYPYIGSSYAVTTDSFHGYIDDLRITSGVARYTTNFTPPTSQLQDQ
jgi:hypothetical protein